MPGPLITTDVLRLMAQERIEAMHRGEITAEFLAGYLVAFFHCGAITADECSSFLNGQGGSFSLTPPDSEA